MLESRVYKKWQTSARDREIQSKIWSLAVYLGELTAVPGNVMKHNSYYATMAQTIIQVKTTSLFSLTLFYKLKFLRLVQGG